MFFVRCFHTFINDSDLSKRDEQVTTIGHCFIRGLSRVLWNK